MNGKTPWGIIVIVAMVFLWLIGNSLINNNNISKANVLPKYSLNISAVGRVYAKPDLALIIFSVTTEAKTTSEALNESREKMNAIIGLIKSHSVQEKDLKTVGFNIYPRYEYYDNNTVSPQRTRVLVGYNVSQSLQVKIRNFEKIGEIIDGAIKSGANEVGNLQFIVDNTEELEKQAREDAILKAKAKAEELASQLGITLGRIINFSESNQGSMPPRYNLAAGGTDAPSRGATQVEEGENKIEVAVTITYEIK